MTTHSTINDLSSNHLSGNHASRHAEYQVHPVFLNRWSPRAFNGEAIDEATLFSLFEAARWSPSGNNSQPWRFIYTYAGSPSWLPLFNLLAETNQKWAAKAAVLVVLISKTSHLKEGEAEAKPLRNHSFDAGAAWASLAFQAEYHGLRTHAIGGFDREKARAVLNIPQGYSVEIAIAIGKQGDVSTLPPDLQAREKPNQRKPLKDIVAEGQFNFPD